MVLGLSRINWQKCVAHQSTDHRKWGTKMGHSVLRRVMRDSPPPTDLRLQRAVLNMSVRFARQARSHAVDRLRCGRLGKSLGWVSIDASAFVEKMSSSRPAAREQRSLRWLCT
jgi:hypothetical protein